MNTMTKTPATGHASRVTPESLSLYHKNPRLGDVEAIKASMLTNGVYKPLVVNEGTITGRPMEVLAGNHSLKAIRELHEEHPDDPRWAEVDVWLIDVEEDHATKIVLADNKTADNGDYDSRLLLELLESVDNDLDGTGYDYEELDDLILEAEKTSVNDDPFESSDPMPRSSVASYTVVFDTEEQLAKWSAFLRNLRLNAAAQDEETETTIGSLLISLIDQLPDLTELPEEA